MVRNGFFNEKSTHERCYMIITGLNDDIPEWLKPHMQILCKCGGVMADDGPLDYRGVMKLTQRFCLNPRCPYHMAEKVQMLAKYFNIGGVGPETALDLIRSYKFKSHLDALKIWFADKPSVYLYEVGELSYIYGIKSKWKDMLAGYTSFEQYFTTARNIPEVALSNAKYLVECEQYFNVKQEKLSTNVLKVMITGSLHGFTSRQEFIELVNNEYKDYFRIEDNKKTVRDTYCLIKEPESVDYSKTAIAVNNNIPVMSSKQFLLMLKALKEAMVNEDEDGRVCGHVLPTAESTVEDNGEGVEITTGGIA